jgi:hypothetical protein
MPNEEVVFLRMDVRLKSLLADVAHRNHLSMNRMGVRILKEYLEAELVDYLKGGT